MTDDGSHDILHRETGQSCVTRGDKAPLFQAEAFINGTSKKVGLADYKGDWVVLFFYSSDFTFV